VEWSYPDKSLKQLGIQPKGEYITKIPAEYVTDTELTEKLKSYPTKEEQAEELEKKLDKNQGAENTGKALVVGEDGTVKPGEIPIKVDDTLSQTGQAADAEKVGARLHEIDAVKLRGPVETVSGEILQIENPAEQPPVGMRVYGKAEQNTTTGAQLLNAPDKTNKIFGVTMSVSGGIASFSGTLSSNNATFWFIGSYNGTDVVMTLPAGKYYLQNCSMQTLGNSALKTGAITSETEIQITGVAYTYTDSSSKTIYPMINAGSKALPWEPYTGEKPSPSPEYPQEIEIPGSDGKIETSMNGKNLATGRLYYVNYSDGHAFIFNKEDVKLPYTPKAESNGIGYIIPCKKGRTYTLSVTNPNKNASLGITEYRNEEEMNNQENNINSVIAGGEAKSQTITAIGNGVLVCMLASVWTDGKSRIHTCTESELLQVEIGEEATEYEPPRKPQSLTLSTPNGLPGLLVDSGGNYTDSNGQQWICDSVEFYSDGTGKKIQRLKRASGLAFKKVSYGIQEESYLYETYLSDLSENGYPPCLCTGLKYDKRILDNNLNGMYAYPKSIRARFKDSKNEQEDIEKLKTFEFLYALQTPIETDLSSEEIAAYRALKLNNPVTNVFTAESLMPGIAVDYVPETERYIEKSINDNTQKAPAIVEKASGEMLNITDSSDLGLKGLKVFGKSGQLKTTGAQLFDASKLESKQSDGITITNNGNGSFTINGTSTGYPGTSYNIALENGMYYISTKDEVDVKNIFRVRIRKNDSYEDKGVGTSFKIDGTEDQVQIYIQADKGFSFNNVVIYPMLNAGSTALPWEPYTGGKPSPSPEYPQEIKIPGSDGEIGVKITGAQLLDFRKAKGNENAEGVAYTVLENGSVLRKGTATGEAGNCWFLGDYEIIPSENTTIMTLEAGKTYYIKDCVVYSNTKVLDTGIINISIEEYPDGFKVTGVRNEKQNIKNTYNDIIYPMIAESSTPLPWEPYKLQSLTLTTPNGLSGIPVDSGGNYTDESGQQWICDEMDFEANEIHNMLEFVEGSTLSWTLNPLWTEANEKYALAYSTTKRSYIDHVLSNKFISVDYSSIPENYNVESIACEKKVTTGKLVIYISVLKSRLSEISTKGISEYMKTAGAKFLIPRTSPVIQKLTSEEMAIYCSLHTNYPITTVFTDSILQAGLEMEYVADTKSYVDKKFEELQKALVNTNTQVLNKVMEDIEHV
jgi:hypothetical protein